MGRGILIWVNGLRVRSKQLEAMGRGSWYGRMDWGPGLSSLRPQVKCPDMGEWIKDHAKHAEVRSWRDTIWVNGLRVRSKQLEAMGRGVVIWVNGMRVIYKQLEAMGRGVVIWVNGLRDKSQQLDVECCDQCGLCQSSFTYNRQITYLFYYISMSQIVSF